MRRKIALVETHVHKEALARLPQIDVCVYDGDGTHLLITLGMSAEQAWKIGNQLRKAGIEAGHSVMCGQE